MVKRRKLYLSFLMLIIICFVSVTANANETGLIWDSWETYIEDLSETSLNRLAILRPGDIDGNGKISAADARLALRAAVQLEQLTENQRYSADTDKNFSVNSTDARNILRASIGLNELEKLTVKEAKNWGFIIGPLETEGSGRYYWQLSDSNNYFDVKELSIDTDKETEGAPVKQFFIFTPKKAGSYTFKFILSDSKQNEIFDEFEVNVTINETNVKIATNESYVFEGLKNSGSGAYNWYCTVTPDTGLSVQKISKEIQNGNDGAPIEQIFIFSGTQTGIYTVHFELKSTWDTEPIDEFYMEIAVT